MTVMRSPLVLAATLAAASFPAAAGTPDASQAAEVVRYRFATYRIARGAVYRQQPFPGMTLVQVSHLSPRRGDGLGERSPDICWFLVKGSPEDVANGKIQPEDVVQMSCERHYVRTAPAKVYWR